ncbi:MAG: YMGG-like glycine zipper-containing protein, partial [Verrucomicrobiota bacterium]
MIKKLLGGAVTTLGLLSLTFLTTSCEPSARSGAIAGAAAGALVGAISDDDGDVIRNAAIGAGIGAAAGAVVKARRYRGGGASGTSGNYPTASRTGDPNLVKSPYSPYNVVDVRGFRSGELAIDPTTN